VTPDENTYVRDQNARVDPIFTLGTITVASLRDILADLPDDAVVVVAKDGAGGDDCSPLADVEESWYFRLSASPPRSGATPTAMSTSPALVTCTPCCCAPPADRGS
jgi:3-dehydroquinate synthase class II